jgi:hypothetical protein
LVVEGTLKAAAETEPARLGVVFGADLGEPSPPAVETDGAARWWPRLRGAGVCGDASAPRLWLWSRFMRFGGGPGRLAARRSATACERTRSMGAWGMNGGNGGDGSECVMDRDRGR